MKYCSKERINGACANLLLKIELTCSYVPFSCIFLFLFEKHSLLAPDPHMECGSGSRRENEFGSMRIQIHSPAYYTILINLQHFNSERHSNAVIFMYIIKTYIKIHNHWSKLNHPSPLLVTNPIITHHARSSNLISQAVHLEEQVQLLHSSHDFLVTTVDEPDQLLKC